MYERYKLSAKFCDKLGALGSFEIIYSSEEIFYKLLCREKKPFIETYLSVIFVY